MGKCIKIGVGGLHAAKKTAIALSSLLNPKEDEGEESSKARGASLTAS
jgi:hypothetical protein